MSKENYNELFLNYLQKNKVLTSEQIKICLQEANTISGPVTSIRILLQKNYCSEETLKQYITQFNQEHTTHLFPEFSLEKETEFKTGYVPTQIADVSSVADAPSSNSIPKNRYILLENIGEGGMGVVQKAKDCVLGREVALKKINNLNSLSSQFSQKSKMHLWRLSREAEITALLEHPNIIPIYDLQYNEQGELYFTMRIVEGKTFGEILRQGSEKEGSVSTEMLLSIFFKVCDAVSYAHSKNIIHRDLKPDNIMVGQFGEVYVMDWGIAKKINEKDLPLESVSKEFQDIPVEIATGEKKTVVERNPVENKEATHNPEQSYATIGGLGTPGYMAPEQHTNASKVTPQSDIYALGVILRQCFILLSPYEEIQLLYKNPHPSVSHSKSTSVEEQKNSLEALIPSDIKAIIQKATNKSIEKRYCSIKEFVFDIECYQKNIRVSAREYHVFELFSKWVRRNKILFRSLFIAIMILSCLGIYLQIEKKQLREKQITEAYYNATQEESLAGKNEHDAGLQIKYFLKAIHYLNIALSLKPMESNLEQKKYTIGRKLIEIACQSKDYNLADYVLMEVGSISFLTSEDKAQLKEYIKNEERRLVNEHLDRLDYWVTELKRKPNWKTKEKAIFEICQMKEKEILQELLTLLQKGTHYLLYESAKDTGSIFCYHVLLEILWNLNNPEAVPVLLQQLQEMGKTLAPIPEEQREELQVTYMLILLRTLTILKAKSISKRVDEIRHTLGTKSRFFLESEEWYRQLIFFEDVLPSPKTAEEFWVRGNIKKAKEDISGAIEDWTQSIQLEPGYLQAYLSRAQVYGKDHYEKALEDYAAVFQLDPDHPRVYELRGKLKFDRNDFQGAVEDFQEFLKKNPERGGIYLNLGQAKRFLRDFKGAIAALDKAIQNSPTQAYPYVLRGISKYESGDVKGALADYNQAILIHPDHANAFSNRGVVYMTLGDFESALFDLNHAIELNKFDTLNFFNRGECLERMKKYPEAIMDYNQTIQIDPHFIPAFLHLVECYKRTGKIAAAIETYEKILTIQPVAEAFQGLPNLAAVHIIREYAKGETSSLKKYILLFNKYAPPYHLKYAEVNKILQKIEQDEKDSK